MKTKLMIGLISALMLTGCDMEIENNNAYFEVISSEENGFVVVDTTTNVEYWMSTGAYNRGSLTLLVDENGKPLICEREVNNNFGAKMESEE